jgi:hypothetical protein
VERFVKQNNISLFSLSKECVKPNFYLVAEGYHRSGFKKLPGVGNTVEIITTASGCSSSGAGEFIKAHSHGRHQEEDEVPQGRDGPALRYHPEVSSVTINETCHNNSSSQCSINSNTFLSLFGGDYTYCVQSSKP